MKIIKRIKEFFTFQKEDINEKKIYIDFVENILPNLKFGDIIRAERFNNEWEREDIEFGHEDGPYIVVGRDGDKVIGCYCTSVSHKKKYFQVGENYNLIPNEKKTYTTVKLNMKTIDYISFREHTPFSLNYEDKDRLMKRLKFDNIYYDDFGLLKKLDCDFDVEVENCDILFYNYHYYIVTGQDENAYHCLKLNDDYSEKSSFVNLDEQNFDFDHPLMISKEESHYTNSLSYSLYNKFLQLQHAYDLEKKKKLEQANVELKRGDVIVHENKFYYIYNIHSNEATLIYLYYRNEPQADTVKIGHVNFAPHFDKEIKVRLKELNAKPIVSASDEEISNIREVKKSFLKNKKKDIVNKASKIHKSFKEQTTSENYDVIKTDYFFGFKFLITSMNEHEIETISLNDYLDSGRIICYKFDKRDAELKSCHDLSEEEIDACRYLKNSDIDIFETRTMKHKCH